MLIRSIGEVIKARRVELGLTQEQLCEGICERVTLSRLENGKQSPSYGRVKALLQRLDLPDDRYTALLDEDELRREELKEEVSARVALFRNASIQEAPHLREKALEAIHALEDFNQGKDPLIQQYAARFKVSLGTPDGPYSLEASLSMLLEAIRITVPGFDLEQIGRFRYSREELALIICIANTYIRAKNQKSVLRIYRQLVQYTQDHGWDQPLYAERLAVILCNYALALSAAQQYREAVTVAQQGWDVCVKYNECQCLGVLLAIQANSYFHLDELAKSRERYYQAFYILSALKDISGLAHLRNDARDTLKLEFN